MHIQQCRVVRLQLYGLSQRVFQRSNQSLRLRIRLIPPLDIGPLLLAQSHKLVFEYPVHALVVTYHFSTTTWAFSNLTVLWKANSNSSGESLNS